MSVRPGGGDPAMLAGQGEHVLPTTHDTHGGGSRPLVPIADFLEIMDFRTENLRASRPHASASGAIGMTRRDGMGCSGQLDVPKDGGGPTLNTLTRRWVHALLLLALATLTQLPAKAETLVVCNPQTSQTNVRSGPTTKDTTVVDKLPNDTHLDVLERVKNPEGTHDWLKVTFKHSQTGAVTTGFVYHGAAAESCNVTLAAVSAPVPSPAKSPAPASLKPEKVLSSNPLETWEVLTESHPPGDFRGLYKPSIAPDNSSVLATIITTKEKLQSYHYTIIQPSREFYPATSGVDTFWEMFLPTASPRILSVSSYLGQRGDDLLLRVPGGDLNTSKTFNTGSASFFSDKTIDPTGRFFAAHAQVFGSEMKGVLHVLDMTTGKLVTAEDCAGKSAPFRGFAKLVFSNDGTRVAAIVPEKSKLICVYDTASGSLLARLEDPTREPASIAFIRDNDTLLAAAWEGPSKIWNISTRKVIEQLPITHVIRVVASPTSERAVFVTNSGPNDVYVHELWDLVAGRRVALLAGANDAKGEFSRDGSLFAYIARDNGIDIANPADGTVRASLSGRDVAEFSFSPNGKMFTWIAGEQQTLHVAALGGDEIQRITASRKVLQDRIDSLRAAMLEARAKFDCERMADLAKQLDVPPEDDCPFERIRQKGGAQEIFLEAAKLEVARERGKAKKLYEAIMGRFPNDPLAVQAAMRMTSIADAERSEDAQKSVTETAARAAQEAAAATARAQNVVSERYWDCRADYGRKTGAYGEPILIGGLYPEGELRLEIRAASRSDAESKMVSSARYVDRKGLLGGSSTLFVCPPGANSSDGQTCAHWFTSSSCYAQ